MKKDIFIDTDVATTFTNPISDDIKELITWLRKYDKNSSENPYLVVSQKILVEYLTSLRHCCKGSSMVGIINVLTREGRINKISNNDIKSFKIRFYKKHIIKRFQSNNKDQEHIPVVMLSERKLALSNDDKFIFDINNFPRFRAIASKNPKDLNYKE